MTWTSSRREFIRNLGIGTAALPFILNLPSLGFANQERRKKRLVVMFSPDGIIPPAFWPEEVGEEFTLKEILEPLEPFQERTLILNGVCDRLRGDGDAHMRGMGCLLTGIELYPGNIQGGGNTPAGWAKGISIDQEIKNFLQKDAATRTRFGSLEFGVLVPGSCVIPGRVMRSTPARTSRCWAALSTIHIRCSPSCMAGPRIVRTSRAFSTMCRKTLPKWEPPSVRQTAGFLTNTPALSVRWNRS